MIADSVGLALLVVLEQLEPAERLAFVLHDMFAVPFDEIAPMVDRTPAAARQLASRARRIVRGTPTGPGRDLGRQRKVVAAFLAAARAGDFAALLEVLHPDVAFRVRQRTARHRARRRCSPAHTTWPCSRHAGPALRHHLRTRDSERRRRSRRSHPGGTAVAVVGMTVIDGMIGEIDLVLDPDKLRWSPNGSGGYIHASFRRSAVTDPACARVAGGEV